MDATRLTSFLAQQRGHDEPPGKAAFFFKEGGCRGLLKGWVAVSEVTYSCRHLQIKVVIIIIIITITMPSGWGRGRVEGWIALSELDWLSSGWLLGL